MKLNTIVVSEAIIFINQTSTSDHVNHKSQPQNRPISVQLSYDR